MGTRATRVWGGDNPWQTQCVRGFFCVPIERQMVVDEPRARTEAEAAELILVEAIKDVGPRERLGRVLAQKRRRRELLLLELLELGVKLPHKVAA